MQPSITNHPFGLIPIFWIQNGQGLMNGRINQVLEKKKVSVWMSESDRKADIKSAVMSHES
jgi:hypothetical protein